MIIKPTFLEGVFEVENKIFKDHRGLFVKTFQADVFKQSGLNSEFKESFFSVSKKNVLRGMHLQLSPNDHAKLVYVTHGEILDVAVDIRKKSNTFGQFFSIKLSFDNANSLYMEKGFAHGFQTLTDDCEMLYFHTAAFQPAAEGGLNIKDPKLAIQWPLPITEQSPRDLTHPVLTTDFTGVAQ